MLLLFTKQFNEHNTSISNIFIFDQCYPTYPGSIGRATALPVSRNRHYYELSPKLKQRSVSLFKTNISVSCCCVPPVQRRHQTGNLLWTCYSFSTGSSNRIAIQRRWNGGWRFDQIFLNMPIFWINLFVSDVTN